MPSLPSPIRLLLAVPLAAAAMLPAQASRLTKPAKLPPPAPLYRVIEDESYADAARDHKLNELDLYLPVPAPVAQGAAGAANPAKPPLVMFVHGGGWIGGSKNMHRDYGKRLAERGIACAMINYRLSPIAKFPDHEEDCVSAFAWLRANAEQYGYDQDAMFLMGHSAGGHLVSLLAFDDARLQAHGLDRSMIRGVISMSGVYDVRFPHPLLREVFGKEPRELANASPIVKAHRDAPPFFICWGSNDLPGLPLSATMFRDRLRALDVDVAATELRGENHVSYVFRLGAKNDVIGDAMLRFLNRVKPPVAATPSAETTTPRK